MTRPTASRPHPTLPLQAAALALACALCPVSCAVPEDAGSLVVTVVDPAGAPLHLARVDVVGHDADLTSLQGESRFGQVPPGPYVVRASLAPRCSAERVVTVRSSRQESLTLVLPPRLELGADRGQSGFGETVVIAASDACGDEPVRWTVLEGDASRVATEGDAAVVRTRPLPEVVARDGRPGVVPISRLAAQVVRLRAEVGDEGAADEILVSAAPVSGGVFQVATGADTYFDGGAGESHRFSLSAAPAGSLAALDDADTRFPKLRPDLFGTYRVRDDDSGLEMEVEAGRYDEVPRDCGRLECHPVESDGFAATAHASTFWRGLAGELGPAFRDECTVCHAVGSDPLADTGGWDDVVRVLGWRLAVPAERASVPPRVADLANVWCTACHGPGRIVPTDDSWERGAKYSADVCAPCHDGGTNLPTLLSEWRSSRMARFRGALGPGDPALERGCARCHSAQGFVAWQREGSLAAVADARIVQPITCAACHDPHAAEASGQLRVWDAARGSSALCVTCHTAQTSLTDPVDVSERRAPHAPQGEIVLGARSPHGWGRDACAACHMAGTDPAVGHHSFTMRDPAGGPNVAACTSCHAGATSFDDFLAAGDWDGDGARAPHVAEVDGLVALLGARIATRLAQAPQVGCGPGPAVSVGSSRDRVVVVDAEGRDLGDCDGDGTLGEGETPALVADETLYRAGYAWLQIAADGSRGLHDPRGQVRALQDAILSLPVAPGPPWDRPVF